jgi:hypothetical protein
LLKLKHVASGEYLSLEKNAVSLKGFSSFNLWEFKMVPGDDLTRLLFVNSIYVALKDAMGESQRRIHAILNYAIEYCYK